ncbi:MAG: PAS domain-containing protein [Bdellovibrionales bacterium]|nr:PAS domain-containing protein [Bdellovibrionales bacterium]
MSTKSISQRILQVVPSPPQMGHGFSVLHIHGIRTVILFVILLASIIYQLFQKEFINTSVWLPVYITLFLAFLANAGALSFIDRLGNKKVLNGLFFAMDAVVYTLLIHYTSSQGSLFFLFYLTNLVLAGMLFDRWSVFALAFWTSFVYGIGVLLDMDFTGQSLYINLIFNNIAIISVAGLSSALSEQFSFLGEKVQTATKKAEILENLNSLIVSNIASGLLTIDKEMNIVTSNEAAHKILGGANPQGQSLSSLFPSIFQILRNDGVSHVKGSIQRFELPYDKEEQKLILELLLSPLIDDENEPQGYLILFQDLTELKRLEKQVRQQDKLAAVGQLAAGIAHEIRNPLASISGSIQLLVGNPDILKEEDLKLMRIVLREIDRLNGLITEFLEFVRPDVQATEQVNIDSILKEVLEMVRFNKSLPQDVHQKTSFTSKMPILGHRDKLKQAFLNIVINSYQAMVDSEEKSLSIKVFDDSNHLKVVIEDTGCGIEEKTLDRIFEPFLTTKPKGTGLGLAITHKILESHGAKIFVESEVGKGTTFNIEFPFGAGPQPNEEVSAEPAFGTA